MRFLRIRAGGKRAARAWVVVVAAGLFSGRLTSGVAAGQAAPASGGLAPTLDVQPSIAAASGAQWTLTFSAPYCGGPGIGGYVQVEFPPPLTLSAAVTTAGTVTFNGRAANVTVQGESLQVSPAPQMWPQYCSATPQTFSVVFSPDAGLAVPADPGTYLVNVSTGSDPTAESATFSLSPPSQQDPADGSATPS